MSVSRNCWDNVFESVTLVISSCSFVSWAFSISSWASSRAIGNFSCVKTVTALNSFLSSFVMLLLRLCWKAHFWLRWTRSVAGVIGGRNDLIAVVFGDPTADTELSWCNCKAVCDVCSGPNNPRRVSSSTDVLAGSFTVFKLRSKSLDTGVVQLGRHTSLVEYEGGIFNDKGLSTFVRERPLL